MPLELMGFPSNSAGKQSSCNAEDPSSIPGLGRSAGEGTSYLLQYFGASLVGSDGKETTCNVGDFFWIPGLGRSLEKGMATHFSILTWRILWTV